MCWRFGSMLVVLGPLDRMKRFGQRAGKHLVHMIDRNDLQPFLHRRRQFGDILLVLRAGSARW